MTKSVRIIYVVTIAAVLTDNTAVLKVDGEPWMQRGPCTIELSHLTQVNMLLPRLPPVEGSSDSGGE